MPGGTARSPDGRVGEFFTAPVLQWLQQRGCRGVHALDDGDGPAPAWRTAPVGPHGSDISGWHFGFRDGDGGGRGLLLGFADREALSAGEREALAGYLALAGNCAGGGAGPAVLVDRDMVSQRIHDLRNGLNSLLMNVAVLGTKLPESERHGRFASQVQVDGERCAALLQELADTVRPPEPPLAG
jgi:hypothetical protein